MQIRCLLFMLSMSVIIPTMTFTAGKGKKKHHHRVGKKPSVKRPPSVKGRPSSVKTGRRVSSKGKPGRVTSRKPALKRPPTAPTKRRVAKPIKRKPALRPAPVPAPTEGETEPPIWREPARPEEPSEIPPAPVPTEEVPAAITPKVTPTQVSEVAPAPGSLAEQLQVQRRALRKVGAAAPAAAKGIGMIPPLPSLNEQNFPDVASLEKFRDEKGKLFMQASPAQQKEITAQLDQINEELNRRGMVAQLVPLNEENFPTMPDLEQYREIKNSLLGTANDAQKQELKKQIAQIDAEIARRAAAQ
ncbi:MAG TPA: hypothetical protein VFF04_03410 [Candidatus Babeliales bacterium]|nr:hypothetical protein [Candidatus Babeliales bacterium]